MHFVQYDCLQSDCDILNITAEQRGVADEMNFDNLVVQIIVSLY